MPGSRTGQGSGGGSARERETPPSTGISYYFAISCALGAGPDLPVIPVSMMEKKATCVGKRLCVGIVIAPSQNRLVYASLVHCCNTHVLGPTISYICMCKNS